jgi:serine/threonine protein phosphatase 1
VNRIGIDIGAFRSGVLAAIGLEGRDRWFIFAREALPERIA